MCFSVILFILTSCSGLSADSIATTASPNTDFVDVLKQDLRRNNDDYIEKNTMAVTVANPYLIKTTQHPLQKNDSGANHTLTQGKFYYRRGPTNLLVDTKNNATAQRRVFDSLESMSSEMAANVTDVTFKAITRNTSIKTARTIKVTRTLPRSTTSKVSTRGLKFNRTALNKGTNFRSFNNINKDTHKMNKIKSFIGRNKQLFAEFMNKKKMEMQNNMEPPQIDKEMGYVGSEMSAERGKGLRQRTQSHEATSLRPEELDMAPAKGGQIHAMRIKGRLCQRSVLIPEGPKYNSRGEQYLGAYGHHQGRDYSRTRRPKLVLPRCCNCCKKSVLGCE